MGWVPPPAPRDPEARVLHRQHLVHVLGYDPALGPAPRARALRYILRSLFGPR